MTDRMPYSGEPEVRDLDVVDLKDLTTNLGSLERDAFEYLGEWKRYQAKDDQPYGFHYRLGVKANVPDSEGDPAVVFLHFVVPFTTEGHAITQEREAHLETVIADLIRTSALRLQNVADNTINMRADPPDYMLTELLDI